MNIIKLFQIAVIFMFLLESTQAQSSGVVFLDIIILYACIVWTPFFTEEHRGGNK
jgi:hypothetical protein